MKCNHAATVADPVLWALFTDPLPHHEHAPALMSVGEGMALELRNCRRCRSTISRPFPGGDMGTQETVQGLLDEVRRELNHEPSAELAAIAKEMTPAEAEETKAIVREIGAGLRAGKSIDAMLPLGVTP